MPYFFASIYLKLTPPYNHDNYAGIVSFPYRRCADQKTAAHKKLPFGTKVKVTNIKNSKRVIVKINDKGPFVKGRIIDLSGSAFSSIASFDDGVINVKIEVIK